MEVRLNADPWIDAAGWPSSAVESPAPAAKGPNAPHGNSSASGCGEDSFLGTQFPAAGVMVSVGEKIGAVYHDETPLNQASVRFTVDGKPVSPQFAAASVPK